MTDYVIHVNNLHIGSGAIMRQFLFHNILLLEFAGKRAEPLGSHAKDAPPLSPPEVHYKKQTPFFSFHPIDNEPD